MLSLFAQASPPVQYDFLNLPVGSNQLNIAIIVGLLAGFALFFGCMFAPQAARRPITWTFTFAAGLFYFLLFIVPQPVSRSAGQIPNNPVESVSFWLEDTLPRVADTTNILATLLLGLGVYSLLRIHGLRMLKKQKDWGYSAVLLGAMFLMIIVGYTNWTQREVFDPNLRLEDPANWGWAQISQDLLFNGLLMQMDSAMFSMIAFFILSAAYRAFRIRSIEATILMASALILMLSIMGAVDHAWGLGIDAMGGKTDPGSFVNNFRISVVAGWIQANMQTPAIRALEFGVGLGALAMGLRLWLGLEKGGVS